jgi:hypothetical protein
MSRTLHALIIGINEYPMKPLSGCVPDATAFHKYLEGYCKRNAWTYKPTTLFDKQASRDAVIKGYKDLQKAKAGDTCVVYFSGHGWHVPAPPEFWVETNRENQVMVCADSMDTGRVLIDKEIAYLGSMVTKDKEGVHFLEVFDCCHSQSITRSVDNTVKARTVTGTTETRGLRRDYVATEYLGFEHYKQEIDPITKKIRRLSPPMPKRVLLSACLATEEAKEDMINGVNRGFFTLSLIQALTEFGENLTYSELMEYTYFKTKNLVAPVKERKGDQTPQFDTNAIDPNTVFLTGEVKSLAREYLVGFDVESKQWVIKAGEINGLPKNQPIKLRLKDSDTIINVNRVMKGFSVLDVPDSLKMDKKRLYKARIIQMAQAQVEIDLPNTPLSTEIETAFKKQFGQAVESLDFRFVQNDNAPYLIQADNAGFAIMRSADKRIITRKYTKKDMATLFEDAATLGRYHQLLNLKNPTTRLTKNDVQIKMTTYNPKKVVEAHTDFSMQKPVVLTSLGEENSKFTVEITNKYGLQKKLWVSVLYMADSYDIMNGLLPNRMEEVLPGNTVSLSYDGDPYIEIAINEDLVKSGVKSVTEYLKVIVSTDVFNTDDWNQEGISLVSTRSSLVKSSKSTEDPSSDWAVFEVPIRVQYIG